MTIYEELVAKCYKAMETTVNVPYNVETLKLRQKLINEEIAELNYEIDALVKELESTDATTSETQLKMFKELADVQYVLSGLAISFGIPIEEVFKRVHQSNMSKLVDGKPLKRADGKFLKGPNYQKPHLDDLADEIVSY